MPDTIDFNVKCDELVYSTFDSIDGNKFANKEACVQELLPGNDAYNNLPSKYQEKVADRLWTHYERPYIRKILNAINPDYFKIEEPSSGHKSPHQAIVEVGQLSRVFDELPHRFQDLIFEKKDIEAFFNDFLLYGEEFALAGILNPILLEVIDFDKNTLKAIFVDTNLGQSNYDKLKSEASEAEASEAEIAKILIEAFTIFFHSYIRDKFSDLPLTKCYIDSRQQYKGVKEKDKSKIPKLFDKNDKYLFCSEMQDELKQSALKHPDKFKSFDPDALLEQFNLHYPLPTGEKQRLLAQLVFDHFKNCLIPSPDNMKYANQLLKKYDYDHQMNLKQLQRVNLRRGLSVFFTLLFAGAAVAIGFFTFGAGTAAIMPFVPNIALFATSAVLAGIGFFSSLYNAWKSRSISQSIASFEAAPQAHPPAPSRSIDTSENTSDKLNNALAPSQGNEQVPSSPTSSRSSKDALSVTPTNSSDTSSTSQPPQVPEQEPPSPTSSMSSDDVLSVASTDNPSNSSDTSSSEISTANSLKPQ